MSLPWLFLLHLALLLLLLSTKDKTNGFETDKVTPVGNQTVYTKAHDHRSLTQDDGKLITTNGATRELLVTEECEPGKDTLQKEPTANGYGSETVTFTSTQKGYTVASHTEQTNSQGDLYQMTDYSPVSDADICISNQIQQQRGLESENQTNSNTCKSGRTGFEGELVSSDVVATVRFITEDIVTPIIAFPGCVFNILSIYVLVKQGTESSSTRYLIVLGLADLCYLTSTLLAWILILLKKYQYALYVSAKLFLIYASLKAYFLFLTGRYSNVMVLLLSLDRFIAVKFPLRAKTSPLSRHPVKFAIALFIFLTAFLIPNFFRAEFVQMTSFDANKSELAFKNSPISHAKPENTTYNFILVVIFRLSPVLLTFVLNVAIILVMKFSSGSRVTTHMTDEKRQQRELKITRMLVTVSLIFLICVTPGLLHVIIANFYPAYSSIGTYRNIYLVLSCMFPILDAINSTVNFFVYVLLSKRFRVIFLETFCHRLSRHTTTETVTERVSN